MNIPNPLVPVMYSTAFNKNYVMLEYNYNNLFVTIRVELIVQYIDRKVFYQVKQDKNTLFSTLYSVTQFDTYQEAFKHFSKLTK